MYRATWPSTDVFSKKITEGDTKKFLDEVKLWSNLRHVNVVSFYGANHCEPLIFIVYKFAADGQGELQTDSSLEETPRGGFISMV